MKHRTVVCFALASALLVASTIARADSFASSASSAGSESSGSVSASLRGSSGSSSKGDRKAEGPYRIVDVAAAPDDATRTRVTMQRDDDGTRLVLELPRTTFARQDLGRGDLVRVTPRVYGFAFSRADTPAPFYLVLADDWQAELAPRLVER